ncbi:MAG: CAP domain-containing protein, partial [Bacteroidota bacterium]
MKKGLIFVFGILLFPFIHGQGMAEELKKWDKNLLTEANTAENADYLSTEEKQIIFLTNLARLNGEKFSETILDKYLENQKSNSYTRSLYRDLKKIKDLPVLKPGKDLYDVAEEHAVISGKKGTTGHQRFEKRYGPLLGKYNEVAENCAYGYESPLDIFIQLLIDEDVPDLGHRKNLLNPN